MADTASPPPATDAEPARLRPPQHYLGRMSWGQLWAHAAFDWAVLATCWAAMLLLPRWTYPLTCVLCAGRLHALGVLVHEVVHGATPGPRWRWWLLEALIGLPVATTFEAMRYHHQRHHKDLGLAGDPYHRFGRGLPRPWQQALAWGRTGLIVPFWWLRAPVGLVAAVLPGLRPTYARVFLQDRSGDDLRADPELRACARAELRQVLFGAALLAAAVSAPATFLLFYGAPALLSGLLVGYRLLREHTHEDAFDRAPATIIALSRDHGLGRLSRALLTPHHSGLHRLHHLHPNVAFDRLPGLRAWYLEQSVAYPR